MSTLKVFRMNDCDWWLAESLEGARDTYSAEVGADCIDEDEPPHELTDNELDTLRFHDGESGEGEARTFREELAIQIVGDPVTPRLFASTEY